MTGSLFIFVLTYGGALAALANPFVGLLIYVGLSVMKPECIWYDSIPPGNYSRIVGIGMLVGWALQGSVQWRLGRGGAVVWAFVAFAIWVLLGAEVAPNQNEAWGFVIDLMKILLPFLVGITTIDSTAKLKQLAWVIVLSQGAIAWVLNADYLSGFNRLVEVGFAGMDNNTTTAGMVTCIGLAFFLGVSEVRWERKAVAFGVALLIGHVILFSESRGGMLALAAAGLAALILMPRRPVLYIVLLIAALLLLQLTQPEARARFLTSFADTSDRDPSAQSRLQLWRDNWDVMMKHPVFGCGPAHWPLIAKDYGWPDGLSGHCLWLQTGAELGVPGLALLVLFYGLCVFRLWMLTRIPDPLIDPWLRDAGRMVMVALAGFVVAAQFLSVPRVEVPYYVVLIGAGVLKLSSVAHSNPRPSPAGCETRLGPKAFAEAVT